MPDFSKARVGDRVYSMKHGWGTIVAIKNNVDHPIKVHLDDEDRVPVSCTFEGKHYSMDESPTFFWSKPEISDPPAPKRMVKRKVEGWVNLYRDGQVSYQLLSKDEADMDKVTLSRNCIGQVFISHEWEEEE